MASVTYSNEDINRFWLQILGDAALIVYNSLSPQETEDAGQAKTLADRFDALTLQANENSTPDLTARINREAFQATQDLRKYFLYIARKLLTKLYYLDLDLAVINNFVNASEKYLDYLNSFMQGRKPDFNPILEAIFWLPIFRQQSEYIADNVGYYEKVNRERALYLADIFNEQWSFSIELRGLSRIGTYEFPSAKEHQVNVVNTLKEYYELLTSLISLQRQNKLPGSMSLLYMDRSNRMACYALKEASDYLGFQEPECNPFAQRVSSL